MNIDLASPLVTASVEDAYIQSTLGSWCGIAPKDYGHLPSMPHPLKRLLLRSEEYESPQRDQWGNWEHSYAENYHRGMLWEPEVDIWLKSLRNDLTKKGLTLTPLWPEKKTFAICLTHDVDYISHESSFQSITREALVACKAKDKSTSNTLSILKGFAKLLLKPWKITPNANHSLETCVNIEKDLAVKSSYFFTVYPLSTYSKYDRVYKPNDRYLFSGKQQTVADIMKHLKEQGHDIGLHGSYFSALNETLLSEQKYTIEKSLGSKITTSRQHWLHWDIRTTPQILSSAGFLADTTLGYNRNIGFRAGTSLPHFLFDIRRNIQLPLLEIPLVIMDGALLEPNSLELPTRNAFEIVKLLLDRIKAVNGCATLLFHPDMFARPGVPKLYRQILEYCLNENAWVSSAAEIQSWWQQRLQKLGSL